MEKFFQIDSHIDSLIRGSSKPKPREVGIGKMLGERCEAIGEPNPYKIKGFGEYWQKTQEYADKQKQVATEDTEIVATDELPQDMQDFAARARQLLMQYESDDVFPFMKRLTDRIIAFHARTFTRLG